MVLLGPQGAKSPGGLYRRHRGQAAMRPVKCDKRRDVNIPHAIAIGKTEFIGADVLPHPSQPSSRLRLVTGINQRHAPWLGIVLMNLHPVVLHVKRHVRHVQKIIGEIFLDDIPLVAETDHKIVDAMG